MSGLECLGKSCTGSQKQLAVGVTSAHADKKNTPKEKAAAKSDKPGTRPARALPLPVQVSRQETPKSGFLSGDVLNADRYTPQMSINKTPRIGEQAQSPAAADKELTMKHIRTLQPSDAAGTEATTQAPPAVEPFPTHEDGEEVKHVQAKDAEDEDIKAPVKLKMELLVALKESNFELASKLCQMILVYEPDHPEASEFLPLIHKKLLEEQEEEQSNEDDDDDDDDEEDEDNYGNNNDDSDSDGETSERSSSSSSSSPSDEDDEEEEERQVTRHKPCPPSHIFP